MSPSTLPCLTLQRRACQLLVDSEFDMANAGDPLTLTTPLNKKAAVWKHFRFRKHDYEGTADKNIAICVICHADVKYCSNTTNLRNHLTRHHPEVLVSTPPPTNRQRTF